MDTKYIVFAKINSNLTEQLKFNEWKNTQSVIEWFTRIEKKRPQIHSVDIKNFYLSIKAALLIKTKDFAENRLCRFIRCNYGRLQ